MHSVDNVASVGEVFDLFYECASSVFNAVFSEIIFSMLNIFLSLSLVTWLG